MYKDRVLNAALVLMSICAVITTGLLVRREVVAAPSLQAMPHKVAEWRQYANGHSLGPSSAPVTIVVFSDYQCPYCAKLTNELRALRATRSAEIRVIYRQFPLASHPLALEAARASECAAQQNRFESVHDMMFALQDSLGRISWTELARRAGVSDLPRFEQCSRSVLPVTQIARDTLDGARLKIRGTPTFLVNETLVQGLPPADTLTAMVENALRLADKQ